MKTVIQSLLLSACLVSVGAIAAPERAPGAATLAGLALDAEREAEVQTIMTHFHEQRRALRKTHREDMRALYQDHRAALSAVLSEEEMAALKDEMNTRTKDRKHKAKFGKRRDARGQ